MQVHGDGLWTGDNESASERVDRVEDCAPTLFLLLSKIFRIRLRWSPSRTARHGGAMSSTVVLVLKIVLNIVVKKTCVRRSGIPDHASSRRSDVRQAAHHSRAANGRFLPNRRS